MMRIVPLICLLLVICSTAWGIEIQVGVMTTAVEERAPVDNVEVFPAADGQLYCFTRVTGAGEPTEIVHVWYRGEQLMSRVVLPVKSPDWRTWSTKSFLPDWQGEWRVEVQDVEGSLLKILKFKLI
ncbi:MAG: DUF2914 domain-containing protein [Desulfuromonadales bacterium]|nr:DUF2914 domain-containing protein [Desulfuromonadales bacterium]